MCCQRYDLTYLKHYQKWQSGVKTTLLKERSGWVWVNLLVHISQQGSSPLAALKRYLSTKNIMRVMQDYSSLRLLGVYLYGPHFE